MRWGFIDNGTGNDPLVTSVQSANAADLEARITAALTAITNLSGDHRVVAVELAGAGAGDVYTARIEYCLVADVLDFSPSGPVSVLRGTPGGFACPTPAQITPVVYMASCVAELAAERTRYYAASAFPQASMVIGSEMAGATQGLRVCVLELIAPTSLYVAPAAPLGPH